MKKSTRFAAAALAVICAATLSVGVLAGCSSNASSSGSAAASSSQAATKTVTDMLGRTVEIPSNVEKVIGIGSALRSICYMGEVDKVVGVEASEHEDSINCAYRHVNHEKFANLPIIGEGGSKGVTPNEEAIINAAPQVIICNSVSADEADALQSKVKIPVVCLNVPETFFGEDYQKNFTLLGEVFNNEKRANELISYINGINDDLKARVAKSTAANTSAYAAGVSFRGGHGFEGTEAGFPPFAACNIKNVADVDGAKGPYSIDLEAISSAQPEYIFIESGNLSLVADDYKSNPAYFNALNAVQKGNTYTLISYRFYATNVELALANCYQVGKVVYPDAFADVDPTQKLDEIAQFFLGAPIASDLATMGCEFKQVDITTL